MKQIAIIGLGRFGTSLARTLAKMGHEVLVVDSSEERVQSLAGVVTHAVQADAKDEETLKSLGLRNFDVVVVAIGEDIQASILVTITLKEMGIKRVVAKATNELHGRVLEKIGADRVIYPERDMGIRLAHNLASDNVLDFLELAPDYGIAEFLTPPRLVGKTLGQLNLRPKYGVNVIAIKKKDGQIIVAPGANDRIDDGDVVVAIGSNRALERVES